MGTKKELYKNLEPFLNCKDHTVSKETYELLLHKEYGFLVTSPVPVDLEKYYESEDYISHTDRQKTLFEKVYQAVKKYTLQKKVSLLNSFQSEEKTVLDIGAGTGDFLTVCKEKNWTVFGVDPNKQAREIAALKQVQLQENISDFSGQQFDVITLWHVLEHVEHLEEQLQELKKLLKENGTLLVAVPNYKSYDADYYKEFWAAYDVPRHLWHFSQKSITKLFAKVSMKVVKTLPMKFDAYYVSLLSEKYKTGKMNFLTAFWVGFRSNWKAKRNTEYSSLIYILRNE